jgi:hypothetical protein
MSWRGYAQRGLYALVAPTEELAAQALEVAHDAIGRLNARTSGIDPYTSVTLLLVFGAWKPRASTH